MNYFYLMDADKLASLTDEKIEALKQNKPGVDFTEFAAGVIYERLKSNINRYRVYGPYWWALKDILRRYDYNVGKGTNDELAAVYSGSNDAETIVAADTLYLEMSNQRLVTDNKWQLQAKGDDYVLYDSDMEQRASITDPIESMV